MKRGHTHTHTIETFRLMMNSPFSFSAISLVISLESSTCSIKFRKFLNSTTVGNVFLTLMWCAVITGRHLSLPILPFAMITMEPTGSSKLLLFCFHSVNSSLPSDKDKMVEVEIHMHVYVCVYCNPISTRVYRHILSICTQANWCIFHVATSSKKFFIFDEGVNANERVMVNA